MHSVLQIKYPCISNVIQDTPSTTSTCLYHFVENKKAASDTKVLDISMHNYSLMCSQIHSLWNHNIKKIHPGACFKP